MSLKMKMEMNGPQYKAKLDLKEGKGSMNVNAALNSSTEVYTADLKINDLQLHHFLPKDSIYELSLSADAKGRGLDVMSFHSLANLNLFGPASLRPLSSFECSFDGKSQRCFGNGSAYQ